MPLQIIRQDITKMQVDAIVNAANTALKRGGGVCGAIFNAAGAHKLQAACDKLAPIQTGQAVITSGFNLPAKYIIHAAGPIFNEKNREMCQRLLYSAYTEALKLAQENKCESIAFPLISSGIYGYPKDQALEVARKAIEDFLQTYDMVVYLAVFDKSAFHISLSLLDAVESYIDEHYGEEHTQPRMLLQVERQAFSKQEAVDGAPILGSIRSKSLDELLDHLDESFADTLFKLIDAKGKTEVEVYKKAHIDRKLFSKIRNNREYTPKKTTILSLAIALELDLDETDALLERAGYALSHANKFDVIVEYFIVSRQYDIFEINEVLFQYDQPLLGL